MSRHPHTPAVIDRGPIFPEGLCAGAWIPFRDHVLVFLRSTGPVSRARLPPICRRITRIVEREQAAGRIRWYSSFVQVLDLVALTNDEMAALERAREDIRPWVWYMLACAADLRADPETWPKKTPGPMLVSPSPKSS
jgi:hypothetical protein